MKANTSILFFFLFGALAPTSVAADNHGAVHIVVPDGEEEVDDGCEEAVAEDCENYRPWYHRERFQNYYGDFDNPDAELEAETAWPGQREDFSDFLMR